MLVEHFIYGYVPKNGYRLVKSRGVTRLLSDTQLQYLSHMGDRATELTYSQFWFPDSDVLAISKITPVKDEYHRDAVWNHTLLVNMRDYLEYTKPSHVFDAYFLPQQTTLSNPLPPIEVV